MRPTSALLLFLVACSSTQDRSTPGRSSGDRPNIVVFMIDDLGWQDLAEPLHTEETPFNRRYRTPNVERLARRGVKFTRAYAAAAVCTPTRTSLMTGRSPAQNHITYWTLYEDRDQSASFPGVRAPRWNVNALQADDVTLPRLLQDAGYTTIHVGKAHFGARGTSGADPTNLGFDVNIAGHAAGGPGSFYGTHDFSAAHRRGSRVWDVPGLEKYHGQEIYLTEALAIEARAAVRAAAEDGGPFFLHFAPYAVHAPIMVNPRYREHYLGLDRREALYATMVETYDAVLGSAGFALHLLDEVSVHQAHIIRHALDHGYRTVEPTPEAEEAWVQEILARAIGSPIGGPDCTPGYYNNEGQPNPKARQGSPYGGGSIKFFELLAAWREEGRFEGLAFGR